MSSRQLLVPLRDADTLVQKLLDVGNSLKPIDDANYYFFEIVRELVDLYENGCSSLGCAYSVVVLR